MSPEASAKGEVADVLRGRILLDVENSGEAWYVTAMPAERHYLGRPEDAFRIMRELGLGITDADLRLIPTEDGTLVGDEALRGRLAGRILLQVESRGEAWYVNPVDRKRYYLGRPADAFSIMRRFGLGITAEDLAAVPTAESAPESIANDVPFVAQAPLGNWSDLRQQEGCEEATALMAVRWARGESLSAAEAESIITAAADWQERTYGSHEDTSAQDTAERIFKGYLGFDRLEVRHDIAVDDIYAALRSGAVVAVPVEGRRLFNPYFTPPGPLRHMLLITGFDAGTDEFITNEPATRRGRSYRYPWQAIASALMDYTTGYHEPIISGRRAMIVVYKKDIEM